MVILVEISKHLGLKRDTIYKWLSEEKIPAQKVGKLWKFKVSEVDEWVKHGKAGN